MKIILYKDVPHLGEEGDVKEVADGYARNFLLPQKMAVRYSKVTQTELEQKQQAITRRKEEKVNLAAGDKVRIENLQMPFTAPAGQKGKLFGSVTSTAVADFLHSEGINIEKKRIEMPEGGIKIVGSHTVNIKLYGGQIATLNVNVSASGDKLEETEAPAERIIEAISDEEEEDLDISDQDYLNQIAEEDIAGDLTVADNTLADTE